MECQLEDVNFDYKTHSVSTDRFIEMASDSKNVVLDLRSEKAFKRGHIKGALHLGADVTKEKLGKLVPNAEATILVYCSDSLRSSPTRMMPLTHTLAPQIYALGYWNVYFHPMPLTNVNVMEKLPWVGSRELESLPSLE